MRCTARPLPVRRLSSGRHESHGSLTTLRSARYVHSRSECPRYDDSLCWLSFWGRSFSHCLPGAVRGSLASSGGLAASWLVELSIEKPANGWQETAGTMTAVPRTGETMRLSDKTLRGKTVISADGKVIGSISELFISAAEWRLESILVELRKEIADQIGANRTLFHRGTIELPVSLVQSVSDAVVLAVDVEELREAHRAPAADDAPQPAT
jgi:sporulation protein YlmC with PRC-barrel domain